MNEAAKVALGTWLFRIDAHCDFKPLHWDTILCDSTKRGDLTVARLDAMDKEWKWLNHWYGLCRLVKSYDGDTPGLEAKWQDPNVPKKNCPAILPNMAATGCGMCIQRAFYEEIGGVDEDLPRMGAIGEELSIKVWLAGGKVQTRTDVVVGHIFGTGGYDTAGVRRARQGLWEKYGDRYEEILAKFPDWDVSILVRPTSQRSGADLRTVIVETEDIQETGATMNQLAQTVERF